MSGKNIGRSAIWSILNQSIGQALVFLVFLVTARFVSKDAFGIMATSMLAVELFKQILIESIGNTFLARKSPTDDDYNAGFAIIFTCGAVAAIVLFSTAYSLASFFGHKDIGNTLRWVSLLLFTTGLSKMHEVWLIQQRSFKNLAIRSVTAIGLGGGVGVFLAVQGYGITSLIVQQIVTSIISAVWLWVACSWRPSLKVRWSAVVEIFHYSKFVSLNSTSSFFSSQGDVLLSSVYLGPAATGIYNAAKRLLVAISLVMSSGLNSVALPLLASLSDDSEQLKDSFLKCVGFTVLITSPIFAGLAVLSPDVIGILMGDRWSDVAPVLSILCIAGFLSSFLQYSTNILLIRRKAHWITLVSLFEALINLLILVVVARHGIIYLALAFVTKSILLSPIMVLLSINIIDLKFLQYWKVIFMPILLSIAMAGIILFLKMHTQFSSLVNLLIMIPFGAILYIALSFIMNKKIFLTMLNVMIKSIKK